MMGNGQKTSKTIKFLFLVKVSQSTAKFDNLRQSTANLRKQSQMMGNAQKTLKT
jgi:hypothetical protein